MFGKTIGFIYHCRDEFFLDFVSQRFQVLEAPVQAEIPGTLVLRFVIAPGRDGPRLERVELRPSERPLDVLRRSEYVFGLAGKLEYFDLATKDYKEVPTNPNILVLSDTKASKGVVKENDSCSLIDVGDGIVCAEFHSKMNTIDDDMGQMLNEGVNLLNEGQFEGMIIANQGEHFCAGANIFVVLGEAMQGNWDKVEKIIVEEMAHVSTIGAKLQSL